MSKGEEFTKANEGCTLEARKDSKGWVIGYGHNSSAVVPGLTWDQKTADQTFSIDYVLARQRAGQILKPVWEDAGDARQAAWVDLVFELGQHGAAQFVHAIAYALEGDWDHCADQILQSDYARQVPKRARKIAALVRSGEWQSIVGLP